MKRIILFCLFISFFSLSLPFAAEHEKLNFSILPEHYGKRLSSSYNNFNNTQIIQYAKVLSENEINTFVTKIERANIILSVITITGYLSNTIIGAFILSEKFQDQSYLNPLFYTHIPLGVTSGLLAATVISLGYVEFGMKKKYSINYSKAFVVSIFVNTALAAAEVGFVVANLITSRLNPEAAKWIGLAHAVTTGCLMIGIAVQLGTSFIKK
jgi:hypothetical protein